MKVGDKVKLTSQADGSNTSELIIGKIYTIKTVERGLYNDNMITLEEYDNLCFASFFKLVSSMHNQGTSIDLGK